MTDARSRIRRGLGYQIREALDILNVAFWVGVLLVVHAVDQAHTALTRWRSR